MLLSVALAASALLPVGSAAPPMATMSLAAADASVIDPAGAALAAAGGSPEVTAAWQAGPGLPRPRSSQPVPAVPTFGWPLAGPPSVVRAFEPPPHPYGPGHRGVDLGGSPGMPVLAAGDGTVSFAGPVAGRPVVSVDNPNGLRTTYEPVTAVVAVGQHVRRGDLLGTLAAGHPGCPVAACLHWGVRRGREYLDPLGLLGLGRVRLLPMRPEGP